LEGRKQWRLPGVQKWSLASATDTKSLTSTSFQAPASPPPKNCTPPSTPLTLCFPPKIPTLQPTPNNTLVVNEKRVSYKSERIGEMKNQAKQKTRRFAPRFRSRIDIIISSARRFAPRGLLSVANLLVASLHHFTPCGVCSKGPRRALRVFEIFVLTARTYLLLSAITLYNSLLSITLLLLHFSPPSVSCCPPQDSTSFLLSPTRFAHP